MTISEADFNYVRKLVYDRSAITLEDGKGYLVESRLGPVARRQGLGSFEELITQLRAQPFNGLHWNVVEAMTTNETSFFRDFHPFEALRQTLLPEFLKRRDSQHELNIWCAACSTGQEPYTLAMMLREHFPSLGSWNVKLTASDLSKGVLDRCREGCYSQMEVNRGMPSMLVVKYFRKIGVEWQIKEEIRRMIEFRQINLAEAWPSLPSMDIILIRNVLIYFDMETKKTILARVRRLLQPDGYLILGGAETTINLDDSFEWVQFNKATVYRLRGHH